MRTYLLLLATLVVPLLVATENAAAQGFPGGSRGMGGRGMRQPHEDAQSTQKPAQSAQNPLVAFLGALRPLRMDLLIRSEQADAWTAMQDALVAVAEAEHDATEPGLVSSDPAVRLRSFVDDLDRRAETTKAASDRIGAVLSVLDDHQKQIFLARLSEAFAGGNSKP